MRSSLVAASLLLLPRVAWAAEEGGSLAVVGGGLIVAVLVCAGLVATRRNLGMLVTAVGGALASAYLAKQHLDATHGASSICNINATFNCDVVNTSTWSEVAGISVALYGLGYFVAMAWLAWRRNAGSGNSTLLLAGASLGTAVSAFMAFQSAQLGAWCLFCMSTYAANLILLIGAVMDFRASNTKGSLMEEGAPAVVLGLAAFIVSLLVYQGQASAGGPAGGGAVAGGDLGALYEKVTGKVVLDGTEPVAGSATARFTIVEWADYECPHCARTAPEMKKLIADNPDAKLLFKHYPISGECNRFVEGQRHVNACRAAMAAECARIQGRFYDMSDAMFANQQYLSPDDIKFIAREKGFDVAALEACIELPGTLQAVRDDVEAGGTAQIDGTPSLFVLGLMGDEWVKIRGGREEIHTLLAAARSGASFPPPQISAGD